MRRGQHVLRVRASDSAGNRSAWTSQIVRFGGSRSAPAGITRTPGWATGLSFATAFTQLPDGRLLVTLQSGELRVVQSDGTLLAQPMLSLSVDSSGERGLLGVTAHPAFASNGFIYVYYTTTQGGSHNRISRFRVSGNTASEETVLVNLPLLGAFLHNSGAVHFGTDGKLYAAVGDNIVSDSAQDLNSVFGKILRFNDDGTIPSDNPHCTTQGNLACAVWARGLRNPFTFAVQPGTGRILINDVGNQIPGKKSTSVRRARTSAGPSPRDPPPPVDSPRRCSPTGTPRQRRRVPARAASWSAPASSEVASTPTTARSRRPGVAATSSPTSVSSSSASSISRTTTPSMRSAHRGRGP